VIETTVGEGLLVAEAVGCTSTTAVSAGVWTAVLQPIKTNNSSQGKLQRSRFVIFIVFYHSVIGASECFVFIEIALAVEFREYVLPLIDHSAKGWKTTMAYKIRE
jgi:hypothetical protein